MHTLLFHISGGKPHSYIPRITLHILRWHTGTPLQKTAPRGNKYSGFQHTFQKKGSLILGNSVLIACKKVARCTCYLNNLLQHLDQQFFDKIDFLKATIVSQTTVDCGPKNLGNTHDTKPYSKWFRIGKGSVIL